MQISKINKKISLALFALFLVFSFFGTSLAQPTAPAPTFPGTQIPINPSNNPNSPANNNPVPPAQNPSAPFNNIDPTNINDISNQANQTPVILSNDSSSSATNEDGTYKWLEQLPGFDDSFDPTKKCSFVDYLNIMIKLLIGIGAVLAMVMIVMGGMEYMTNELISSKEEGISRIKNAMLGLVIALSSYLILNTLNPDLLKLCLDNLPTAKITITDEPEDGIGQGLVGEEITLTKSTGGTVKLKACDQSQMQTVNVFGKSVTVYKGLVPSLQRANTQWLAKPPSERYQVKSIGGYHCRKVKGKSSWSAHAYGTAIDINPEENPFGPNKVTDMPAWFIQILKSEGWGWGGDWNSVKDAMHYSKYPTSENGNGVVEI